MGFHLHNDTTITAIGDAIRAKNGSNTQYKVSQMAAAIEAITGKVDESWHQDSTAVRNFLANVDYTGVAYTQSSISSYAPSTPVPATHTKPAGKVIDGTTFYNEVPGVKTPFATATKAGTVKPLDPVRWIKSQTNNFRDLGGWPCDGGTVKYGLLYRSADLVAADENLVINDLKIRTEVDLTSDGTPAYGNKLRYVSAPASIMYSLNATAAWSAVLGAIFEAVSYGSPTVFHCSMGADRTGTVACILEGLLGMSQSDIDKDYELTSFYALRARSGNYQGGTSDWAHLIAEITALPGSTFRDKCASFVLSLGFTIDEINAFRAAMIDGTPAVLTVPGTAVNLFDSATVTDGARLNSSGSPTSYGAGQIVTGFIDAVPGDIIYVESDKAQDTNGYTGMISAYNSSGTHLGQMPNSATVWVWNNEKTKGYITIPAGTYNSHDYSTTAKVRLCIAYTSQANIVVNKLTSPPSLA